MCHLTKSGRQTLEKRQREIEKRIDEVTTTLHENYGREPGIEDFDFNQLISEKLYLDEELRKIKATLEIAQKLTSTRRKTADLGSHVNLENHVICYKLQLVEPLEANPQQGKLSINSPLGQAVLGKRVGEEIKSYAPMGLIKFMVRAIY